ncbi:MAG: L-glutamate gamma-semialdehyde dehydrogenase [Sedimentisphaerales bacterium]|nr:L-glutamate gamma-semialdehyde dehydrogenase [Sedimentisphaerales bacterium]
MMTDTLLDENVIETGKQFFRAMGDEKPSLFAMNFWTGKVMDWAMKNESFKVQLFRFIDVLPYLTTEATLGRHIQEYFAHDENVPAVLRFGAKTSGLGGKLGMKVLGGTIRRNLERMALQFIIGGSVDETVVNLRKLRDKGNFAFTLDILGEATISEAEADEYVDNYMKLLDGLAAAQGDWRPLGESNNGLDWGSAPKVNISIKPSALYSQADPANFEGTVGAILERLTPIYRKVVDMGGFLCVDTEMRDFKEIIMEVYKRLRGRNEFADYPHLGLAMQVYLKSAAADTDAMIAWARGKKLPISIRLVKGAYWDYEVIHARQSGFDIPVWTIKAQSDMAFEESAEKFLTNHEYCHFACASHNVRSVAKVMELVKAHNVPDSRYEFQALYGMAEPFRKALLKMTPQVRLYCPQGELLPGMAYLIRRLLENTSNESFLRLTFAEEEQMERLLEDPVKTLAREEPSAHEQARGHAEEIAGRFTNEPFADCAEAKVRRAFVGEITRVRGQLGKTYPLVINGKAVTTKEQIDSVNPANPDEIIGKVCQAGTEHVDAAIDAAEKAFTNWRDRPAEERAAYLEKAAGVLQRRIFEISAWQVLEEGKQWRQAYNDVGEAIDFLNYYAHEMRRLGKGRKMGRAPGELNEYFYQPKGLTAVIAPWNFPLAIACGMVSAAIVTGNCVLFKPSNQSPVMGHILMQAFEEVGLPKGVLNYVPGRGSVMGDYLIDHPKIAVIAFTGSMEVGLRIIERAGKTPANQAMVKRVVCEMGGKNAIIVDDDADLDQAVPGIIDSAFTYQGQKCSACSRVIVLDTIYDRFRARLFEAAKSVKIGPAEDPANRMGPVIDAAAQENINNYIQIALREGSLIYQSEIPSGNGYYVPMTIVEGITPEHRLAQEEVFGPVLAVMKVSDFDQALEWANSTRFALTGAVYSRSPEHLQKARERFRVGNLYLNRGSTGAMVERQPFGGFKMSGVGSKAGGPDYLLQFMDPRTVTENTMRRGFAPVRADEEWV